MKKTIEYISLLGTAIMIWRAVQKNGAEELKEDGGEERLAKQIDYARENLLWAIDSKVILDEICADSNGVKMRLGILNDEYKLQFHLDTIDQILYEPILLPAGNMAFEAMKDLKGAFELTLQEINDVINIAKKHIPQAPAKRNNPDTKQQSRKWWYDGKLEKAQTKYAGQKGAAIVRAILRMAYDAEMPPPTFNEFSEKFPDVIGNSYYYEIRKEFEPMTKIEKNAIK